MKQIVSICHLLNMVVIHDMLQFNQVQNMISTKNNAIIHEAQDSPCIHVNQTRPYMPKQDI